ncbi:hypothetical protein [Actinoplanes palleronii]|uniref:Uncharacterized protein n=1 Tax=Actinoplanes palleronii TaxID=113570 RepID=A0ABQ4BDA9_9ACTN|nr:hypothetical protein [Actinoplanes palleronii]GIE68671.1 hypothetical protein Apa02nite_047790 [Actinoplanes palleronii]
MNEIGTAYPERRRRLADATATSHLDPETRERARAKAARWAAAISAMVGGRVRTGSRTPVADLPAWVTLEVLHGGFTTGTPLAGGPLQPWEIAYARKHGLPRTRAAMFEHRISGRHRDGLDALAGAPAHVALPEEAALPVIAWLRRAGDERSALSALAQIHPYAGELRFVPEPLAAGPVPGPETAWRQPVGVVRAALERRRPNPRVESMRATLEVWNLHADRVLALWLRALVDGQLVVPGNDEWNRDARALLAEHRDLAATCPPSRRHAGPKANLTVLRVALGDVLAGREWRRGLVRTVIDDMVRRRGAPGSPEHAGLRARQAGVAAIPPHHLAAHAIAERLATLPQHTGTTEIDQVLAAVDGVPDRVRAVVRRAIAAPVEELVDAGLVSSAEVLAGLAPRIAAQAVTAAYPDPDLRALMAANYLAFRNRRSLLLTDLGSQVRLEELPWVRTVEGHRGPGGDSREAVVTALRRLGGLTLSAFPGTLVPNPMVRELSQLSRRPGWRCPGWRSWPRTFSTAGSWRSSRAPPRSPASCSSARSTSGTTGSTTARSPRSRWSAPTGGRTISTRGSPRSAGSGPGRPRGGARRPRTGR